MDKILPEEEISKEEWKEITEIEKGEMHFSRRRTEEAQGQNGNPPKF